MPAEQEDLKPFADAVAAMRSAQKEYFRTKSQNALADAKRLETIVDKLLHNILDTSQKKLF